MTQYKRFLRGLLRKIFICSNATFKCDARIGQIQQDILWVAFGHKYVEVDDNQNFILTKKGKKFVFPDRMLILD